MEFFLNMTWGDINNGDVGPGMFSWFHILWLAIMIAGCILVAFFFGRKHDQRVDFIVIAVCSVILIMCEVFKQLFWYEFYGYYRFEIFPYQFCSVPIYVAIAATLIPRGKARELCYKFLAFYGIIGGLAVMLIPTAVLYTYFIPMSIHSMVWHAVLVIMGVYLIVSRGYGKSIKELFSPCMLFLGFIALAVIGNILVYKLHLGTPACQPGDNLSMFYISPYYPTQLPLLGAVQEFSYPLFLLCYIILFNSFSLIVFGVARLVRSRIDKKKTSAEA
jgi:uncharacterized membrane protein YwaF